MPVVRAADHNVVLQVGGRHHRLAKVTYGADGSVYVMFPGLRDLDGVVALASLPVAPGIMQEVDMLQDGYTSSHLVKFAYHPDGRVHFSQQRRVRTDVVGSAEPLSSKVGHIFSARFQGIGELTAPREGDRSHLATFVVEEDIESDASSLLCWRYDVSAFEGGAARFFTDHPTGLRNDAGQVQPGVFLAPPPGAPFETFVLFLTVELTGRFSTEFDRGMIFIGGFSSPRIGTSGDQRRTLLVAQYPNVDRIRLAEAVRSLDFLPEA